MFRSAFLIMAAWCAAPQSAVAEPHPLPPPFGLTWGDSPGRLVSWARRTGLDQVVREPGGNRRLAILTVSSPKGQLPDHDASSLEARFIDGRLYEVAVHYTYPGRKADFVKGRFMALKRLLSVRHGRFKPAGVRQEAREGVVTESESYQVKPVPDAYLLLALTEVRDALRGDAAARFSAIYHNDGILVEDQQRIEIRRDSGFDLPAAESSGE